MGVTEGPVRSSLAALMLDKSEKKFVYMVMISEALSAVDGKDEKEIQRTITELPSGLDASYQKFLQQLKTNYPNQWNSCLGAMRLFVASRRPLLEHDVEALMCAGTNEHAQRTDALGAPLRPAIVTLTP